MKQVIKSVFMIACALMISIQTLVSANLPVDLKFLSSRGALKAYAIEQARSADLNLTSAGFADGSYGFGASWENPVTSTELQGYLTQWDYRVRMVNTKDLVNFDLRIRTADFDELFVSYPAQVLPQFVGGKEGQGYELPRPYLALRMADEIPFRLDKSIQRVQISYLDPDGRTVVTKELRTDGRGKFFMDPNFAGTGYAELIDQDWNINVFDLHNGGARTTLEQVRFTGEHAFIDGLVSYENPSTVNYTVWSWQGTGQNPTFEITMNGPVGANVSLTVMTREGAKPRGYFIRSQGAAANEWQYYPVNPAAPSFAPFLDTGTSYLVPDWNPEDFREWSPVPTVPAPCCKGGLG